MASSHLRKVFDPEMLRRVATETEKIRVERGAGIVCVRGLSGTLVASAMCTMFGTPFAVVRKENERSHGRSVELVDYVDAANGDDIEERMYNDWIIVDDLIASGATVYEIRARIEERSMHIRGRCQGIVLYHWPYDTTRDYDLGSGYSAPVFNIEHKVADSGPKPVTAPTPAEKFEARYPTLSAALPLNVRGAFFGGLGL